MESALRWGRTSVKVNVCKINNANSGEVWEQNFPEVGGRQFRGCLNDRHMDILHTQENQKGSREGSLKKCCSLIEIEFSPRKPKNTVFQCDQKIPFLCLTWRQYKFHYHKRNKNWCFYHLGPFVFTFKLIMLGNGSSVFWDLF